MPDPLSEYNVVYDICSGDKNPTFRITETEKANILNLLSNLKFPEMQQVHQPRDFFGGGKYNGFIISSIYYTKNSLSKFFIFTIYVYKNFIVVNDDVVLYEDNRIFENYLFQLAEKNGYKRV